MWAVNELEGNDTYWDGDGAIIGTRTGSGAKTHVFSIRLIIVWRWLRSRREGKVGSTCDGENESS
jgi:hypothetical protein